MIVVRTKVGRNAAEKMSLVKCLDIHVFGRIRTSAHHHETMGTSLLCTNCMMHTISVTEEGQGKLECMESAGIIQEVKEATDWCASMVPIIKHSLDLCLFQKTE